MASTDMQWVFCTQESKVWPMYLCRTLGHLVKSEGMRLFRIDVIYQLSRKPPGQTVEMCRLIWDFTYWYMG